jgi:hypothetical protein
MPSKLTNKEFIEKSLLKHGNRWDYSKTIYNGSKNKIVIICREHGDFIQTASDHLSGCGCPKCDPTKRLTEEEFIKKSLLVHGERWNYSKVVYGRNNYDLVEIICNRHGSFTQRPWAHLRGQGCPKCVNNKIMKTEEFIKRSKEKHGNRWDYSISEYSGRRKDVSIICKDHGLFKQEARVHLEGFGCKMCNGSRLENYLLKKLKDIKEPFQINKKFKDCKNKKPLPFDFYLPVRNILIECDGIQHKKPIEYFGGEERLKYQVNNDKIKTNWAKENNIELVRLCSNLEIDDFIRFNKNEKNTI